MKSFEHENFEIRHAQSLADYLFLRTLRNRVRHNMTNNTASINYIQQMRFYFRKPANVDVYLACVGSRRVGYLLLRKEGPTTLITEAVDEPYRGSGIATRMVQYAQRLYADLTAEILAGNVASIKLHKAAGFTFVSARGNVHTFRYTHGRSC
jgi:ribosomal protein S18 acetylase RimI-like enzyme